MKKILSILMFAALAFALGACGDNSKPEPTPSADEFDVQLTVPASVDCYVGGTVALAVKNGKTARTSDQMMLEDEHGVSKLATIAKASESEVVFNLPSSINTSGSYRLSIKRGERKKALGTIYIKIITKIDFEPAPGSTVYGQIVCAGQGVAGVVVSDGVEVVTTNEKGYYEMASEKQYGYVFFSVPSGYEPKAEGILPSIHALLTGAPSALERVDFELVKAPSQNKFSFIALGDMHLANRTNDKTQFHTCMQDLNEWRKTHSDIPTYGITLGDMTWDIYWYDNHFSFPEYLQTINSEVSGLKIYQTMGNHDNDFKALSDITAENTYVRALAPTYYSFNIGKVHFVVLDDIDCSTYDGTTSRKYVTGFTSNQINWLVKDLQHVPASTPLVITAHAPIYAPSGTDSFKSAGAQNAPSLLAALKGRTVHFVTGHTHVLYNVSPSDAVTEGQNFYEHNSGAVCATWWWTGRYNPTLNISREGTPGGYQVFTVDGTSFSWQYKSYGRDLTHQFRTYDGNSIKITAAEFAPNASASSATAFESACGNWTVANSENYVYINIWNYNPRWKISVTENGTALTPTRVSAKDPLHFIAYEAYRYDANATPTSSFTTISSNHFWRVKAASASSTLEIKVTDEFGNVYSESMQRPKAFKINTYK